MLVYYSHRDSGLGPEDGGDELTERVIRRVTGSSTPTGEASTTELFAIDPPPIVPNRRNAITALDVDRGRIAVVSPGRGEIRFLDGRVAASFKFRGSAEAVALDGSTAAVLVARAHPKIAGASAKFIALFDASSGKSRGEVPVSRVATSLAAGGGWIVYGEGYDPVTNAEGHSIWGFKARTSSVRLHLRTKWKFSGLSVAGRRVAWVEELPSRGRIRAFTLPR